MRSFLVPWLQLAVVQNLDLVLHGLQARTAEIEQLVARIESGQLPLEQMLAGLWEIGRAHV